MKRRVRRKNRKIHKRNVGVSGRVISFVCVIGFSVAAGYMAANYVIGPMLGLESEQVFSDFLNEKNDTEKEENKKENNNETKVVQDTIETQSETGFALQYGSFSAEEGAQKCAKELKEKNIEASIIKKDGSYKVIGKVFDTKEEARNYKNNLATNEDIFITEIP